MGFTGDGIQHVYQTHDIASVMLTFKDVCYQ